MTNLRTTLFQTHEIVGVALIAALLACGVVLIGGTGVLFLLLGIGIIGLVLFRPTDSLFALLPLVVFEPFVLKFVSDEWYVVARYASEAIIYLLCFSVLVQLAFGKLKNRHCPLLVPFVLFIGIGILSVIFNAVPLETGVLGLRQIIRFILLGLAVFTLAPSKIFAQRLCILLCALALIQSAIGIGQALSGGAWDSFLLPSERKVFGSWQLTAGTHQVWEEGSRIFAAMGRYDQLGTFLSLVLLFVVAMLYEMKEKKFLTPFLWSVLLLGLLTLALTYSRASWFGFLLGFLCISLVFKRDKRVAIACGAILLGLSLYLVSSGLIVNRLIDSPRQTFAERLFETVSFERWRGEYYGLGRLFFFIHTPLVVVASSPLFGVGPGMYGGGVAAALHNTQVYSTLALPFGVWGTEGFIDNNWFSLLGEVGILGLAAYLWLFGIIFYSSVQLYRKSSDPFDKALGLGMSGIITAVSLQAFLATYLEMRTLMVPFWILAGLVVSRSSFFSGSSKYCRTPEGVHSLRSFSRSPVKGVRYLF